MKTSRIDRIPVVVLAASVALVFCHASCTQGCKDPLVPTTDADASIVVVDDTTPATIDGVPSPVDASNDCVAACSKLSLLHCPEAEGARYQACLSVCSKSEKGGGVITFNTACIYNAKDVKSVRACNVRCGGE